jgi:hypothetical protein
MKLWSSTVMEKKEGGFVCEGGVVVSSRCVTRLIVTDTPQVWGVGLGDGVWMLPKLISFTACHSLDTQWYHVMSSSAV